MIVLSNFFIFGNMVCPTRDTAYLNTNKDLLADKVNLSLRFANNKGGSRHIGVWFAWKTHTLSMHHLLEHINEDIKRRYTANTSTQQYIIFS